MQNKRTKSGYQVQCDEPRIRDLLQDMLYPITLANAVLFVGVGLFDFGSTRYDELLSICPWCWNYRRTFAPATERTYGEYL
ncbi:hypothetical protein NIES4074_62740 (plasmid) [Cylindrospermum sp. NIES-4074]|nr:hypothetical protein NIES4074_62740 [Cylindrospermum sp. NIES-4074]